MPYKKFRVLTAGVVLAAGFAPGLVPHAPAQHDPATHGASQKTTDAKPTVPPDRDALLRGDGAGQAALAEGLGYPGPKHVLEFGKELKLTTKQRADVQEVYDDMIQHARSLGKLIVKVEEELKYSFEAGVPNEETVEEAVEEAGKLRGRLRGVHLLAHVRTTKLLTKDQITLYVKLRREQAAGAKQDGGTGNR